MKYHKALTTGLFYILSSIIFSQTTKLEKLNTYDIGNNVKEPSGLAFDGQYLYTISDNTPFLYQYTINGAFLERFNTNLKDMEGITAFKNNSLLIAVESTNTLVEYNYMKGNTTKYPIIFENRCLTRTSGIEGVAFDSANNTIYFLNEKDPGALIVVKSDDFQVTNEYKLNFADDYSGAFFVSETNELWITSDKEGLVYRTSLTGEVIETIDPDIDKGDKLEGIALDYPNKLLFLVTDSGQELIKYSFKTEN